MRTIENIEVRYAGGDTHIQGFDRDEVVTQVQFDGRTIDRIAEESHYIGAGLSNFEFRMVQMGEQTQSAFLSFEVHINGEEIGRKTIRLNADEVQQIQNGICSLREKKAEKPKKTNTKFDIEIGS